MKTKERTLDGLNVDAILATPINYDWSNSNYLDDGGWEQIYPDLSNWTFDQCREYITGIRNDWPDCCINPYSMDREALVNAIGLAGADEHPSMDTESLITWVVAHLDDGAIDGLEALRDHCRDMIQDNPNDYCPMMCCYYPLPGYNRNPAADQHTIRSNTACVLATVNDETVLALAGGGMNLSWDICHAYMLLGYFPPFHFTDLPDYAERDNETDQWILAGCLESALILRQWVDCRIETLQRIKAKRS